MLMAGAFNSVTGIVGSIGDYITDQRDKIRITKLQKEILRVEEIKDNFVQDMANCCLGIYYALYEELEKQGKYNFTWDDPDVLEDTLAIFHNTRNRIQDVAIVECTMSGIIKKAPYNEEYYRYLYKQAWTDKAQIRRLACYLGYESTVWEIEIEEYKEFIENLLEEYAFRDSCKKIVKAIWLVEKGSIWSEEERRKLTIELEKSIQDYGENIFKYIDAMIAYAINNMILDSHLNPKYVDGYLYDDEDEECEDNEDESGMTKKELIETYGFQYDEDDIGINPFKVLGEAALCECCLLYGKYTFDVLTKSITLERVMNYRNKMREVEDKYHINEYDPFPYDGMLLINNFKARIK